VVLTAVGLIFKHEILYFFGASSATITYAEQYITIYLLGTVMVLITVGMNPFINLQGYTKTGMMTTLLGAIVNIALDPIFIFALNMGVRGAAIATVISQTCSAGWVMGFLTGKKAILKLKIKNFRLKSEIVGRTMALGASGFVMSITNSLVQTVCNKTLLAYGGDMYVSVMTVVNSVRDIAFAAAHGLSGGATPVLGYNYGAKQYRRVRQGILFTTAATVACAIVICAVILSFPGLLIKIFNNEAELVKVGIPAMRIYFCMFPLMALQLVGQTTSVSLGRAKTAVCFSLLRKAALVTPLTVLLPKITSLGAMGVFAAEPISNVVGGLACYITMMITIYIPLGKMDRGELDSLPGAAKGKK
jgi:putative MATE family efflux protein